MGPAMKRLLVLWCVLVLLAMLGVTTWASLHENVVAAFVRLARDPWGLATLFDAYFAFAAVWFWIAWREACWPTRLLWLAAILLLGNFAIAAYILIVLKREGTVDGLFRKRGCHA